ncbi:MAG: hypothetical protein ACRCZP_19360, partial [Phycicoccus sp.]
MTAGAATTPDDGTSTSSAPTWEEFLADTYVDQDGMYVVNGDEVVDGKENLRIFYDTMVADSGSGGMNDFVVNTVGGQDD